jgi:hypothetical protein
MGKNTDWMVIILSNMLSQKVSNRGSKLIPHLFLSERQENVLISLLNKKMIEELLKLDELEASATSLSSANNLKKEFISKLKEVKSECKILTQNKTENKDKLKLLAEDKRILCITLSYLNKIIRLNHNIFNIKSKKKKLEKLRDFEKEKLYSPDNGITRKWKYCILNNAEETSIDEYLDAYKWFIRNENINAYQKNALIYGKKLLDMILINKDQEVVLNSLYSVFDTIRQRMLSLGDDVNSEREILRLIRKNWKDNLSIYKEKKTIEKDDALYDIMQFWLSSSSYLQFIKNALEEEPSFANCHKHNEHILVDIVRKYIENYKIELRSQTKYYVSKDYYKKIYELYRGNFNLKLRDDENLLVENLLDEFKLFVLNSKYRADIKALAIASIDEMNNNGLKKKILPHTEEINIIEDLKALASQDYIKRTNQTRFDKKYIEDAKREIDALQKDAKHKYGSKLTNSTIEHGLELNDGDVQRILSSSKIVMFDEESVAYNTFINENGNTVLNIHTFDLTPFIPSDTTLDKYFYEMQQQGQKMYGRLQQFFSFKQGEVYPSITYQLEISPTGKVLNLNFKSGIVSIDEVYCNSKIYHKEEVLKELVRVYRVVTKNKEDYITRKNLTNCLLNLFGKNFQSCIEAYDLPFVLWGKNDTSSDDYIKNQFELCQVMSRLKQNQFQIVHKIISQNNDEPHYATKLFVNGSYLNSFVIPSCYVDLYNQRIIKYISNNNCEKAKAQFEQTTDQIVNDLNQAIDYVGEENFKIKCKKR